MRRLKLELKQTIEMYSTACKEALTAKQKVQENTAALHPLIYHFKQEALNITYKRYK